MQRVLVFALIILTASILPATTQNRVIFEANYENLENVSLLSSNNFSTAINFQLGGFEMDEADLSESGYVNLTPLAANPLRFGSTSEEGLPDLPIYSECVIIPDQAGVTVNIISADYETIPDIDIAPTQPFQLEGRDDPMPFTKNENAYQQDQFYPGDVVGVSEPMIMRDFRFVQSVVYPFQYNPVTRELRVYSHIQYELQYSGYDNRNVKIRRDNNISEAFLPIYKSVFANADEVLTDFNVIRGGYLIITPNTLNFPDSIAVLARWKHLKGYYTHITRSTDINPSGSPSYVEVRNYIANAYSTWDVPPDYVLLVGDENMQIPDYPYSGYTSDHQYATVDGSDYISDVLIARMSVDNLSELLVARKKVMIYEKTPDMTDPGYWKRGLGVAGNIYAVSPRIINLWVRDLAIDHGYTHVDTCFDWGSGAPNSYIMSQAINNGVSYVSYRGWAGPSGWYNPSYTTTQLGQLTNGNKLGIMASIVCGTGDFGSSTCFGETWISAGSTTLLKGGPCFYGCTDHSTHTAWNNPNMVGFFWALFEQNIYHFSQLMFMGKQHVFECFPRYIANGGYVNKYFNTYNSLGDPSLEVRTEIPRTLAATYPSSIPVGQNYLTVNVTDSGSPLENAYVNLVKGYEPSEEIFTGEWTDASGNVTFNFTNTVPDTIFVTVTARDYIPHLGYCLSTSAAVALGIDQTNIDDDSFGGTNGNSDGKVNPGELLGLDISLRNYGDSETATNVRVSLSSDDSRITIAQPVIDFPNIAPGEVAAANMQGLVNLASDIPHGENILINAEIESDAGNWQAVIPLVVKSVKPVSFESNCPDKADNRLDPGDAKTGFVLSFMNHGELEGKQISGILSCQDPYITIIKNTGTFGDIDVNHSGNNSADPFVVAVDEAAYNGRNVNFNVRFSTSTNVEFEKTFGVTLGITDVTDPCGPDNYGYYMYDDTDIGYEPHPTYSWIELNPNLGGQGARLAMRNTDDCSELLDLPFDFQYYGETHRQIIVSTNGFIALDTIPFDIGGNYWYMFDNWPIPDKGNARAQISPFWDDLEYSGGSNGLFYYHDIANGKFIIEWSGFTHAQTGSPETFELIICDRSTFPTPTGDNEIIFQYSVINNNDSNPDPTGPAVYSSVGFENWAQDDGLEYEYDNSYHPAAAVLQTGRAIKITTSTGSALQIPALISPPNNDVSSDMTPTLTWSEISEATKYQLQVADNVNFTSPIVNDSTLTNVSYTFASDLPTGQYYWRVRAGDTDRWSGFTATWGFVLSILEVPVTISPANSSSIYDSLQTFVWHSAPGAVRYHIQIDNSSNFDSPLINNSNVTDTTYASSVGIPSGTYYWHIRANDGVIWSDFSGSWSFSTAAPSAPVLLTPPDGNTSSNDPPTFSWQAPEGGLAYDLIVSTHNDFADTVLIYQGFQGTSITPLSAMGEGSYYWHVNAEGAYGYSPFSGTFGFTIDYETTAYEYLPGDVNMYNGSWPPSVIGSDVTYLVNFFRGLSTSHPCDLGGFWCSADANGDCNVIGSDVTKLVGFFRGIGTVLHCADYEPAWNNIGDLPPNAPPNWPNCENQVSSSKINPGGSTQ